MSMAMERGADIIRSEFTTGLSNLHAVEKQARELIERQIERLRNYPEMAMRLRQHLDETNRQEERLDRLLESYGESSSTLKDLAMKFTANMAAVSHAFSDDEIIKNTIANFAFENFEIASYQTSIAMAKMGGFHEAIPVLETSLREEEDMANWVRSHIDATTQQYLTLKASGEKADR